MVNALATLDIKWESRAATIPHKGTLMGNRTSSLIEIACLAEVSAYAEVAQERFVPWQQRLLINLNEH